MKDMKEKVHKKPCCAMEVYIYKNNIKICNNNVLFIY